MILKYELTSYSFNYNKKQTIKLNYNKILSL